MKCGTSSPFFVMVWFPTPKTAVGESLWFHHYAQVIVFFSSRAPILDEIKKWHETKITNTSQKMYFSCLARGAMILEDFFLQQKIRVKYDGAFSPRRSYVEKVPFCQRQPHGPLTIKDDTSDPRNFLRYVSKKQG